MDKAALDEFFAQADDVLTNWNGSCDAMNTGRRGSVTVSAGPDIAAFVEALQAARQGFAQFASVLAATGSMMATAIARAFAPKRRAVCAPRGHGFKPDFDLYCIHAGCGLTAEEH